MWDKMIPTKFRRKQELPNQKDILINTIESVKEPDSCKALKIINDSEKNSEHIHGELVVLGYSSYRICSSKDKESLNKINKQNHQPEHKLLWQPVGRQNPKYTMRKRRNPNGFHIRNNLQYSVTPTNSDVPTLLMKTSFNGGFFQVSYAWDPSYDAFQIGRMPCKENDFVIPGPVIGSSGLVSRFAARILCNRHYPFDCRIYAGGFDQNQILSISFDAPKFCRQCDTWFKSIPDTHKCQVYTDKDGIYTLFDALTKNGIRIWLPDQSEWFEVSVNGLLYPVNLEMKSFQRPKTSPVDIPSILSDGCIIDIGGVQLEYQSKPVVSKERSNQRILNQFEELKVECPIQLHSLHFHGQAEETPYVFPRCGHIFGYNEFLTRGKACPLCRCEGCFVPLIFPSNFSEGDKEFPDCVFNPCGHATSKRLATQYSQIRMPNGKYICPFCAIHLDTKYPFSKLYFSIEDNSNQNDV